MVARNGVVVVLPDFRNCVTPSQPGADVAAFPGGLEAAIYSLSVA